MGSSGAAALRMILSSTSVMFMTWRTGDSGELEEAAQHVDLEESAEVADVAVVVDGGPAGVHAQRLAVGGGERVELSREGVEEAEGHSCGESVLNGLRIVPCRFYAVFSFSAFWGGRIFAMRG